jgi:hypothetical protein
MLSCVIWFKMILAQTVHLPDETAARCTDSMIDPVGFLWHNATCSQSPKAMMETSRLGQLASDPGDRGNTVMVQAGAGLPVENPSGAASRNSV